MKPTNDAKVGAFAKSRSALTIACAYAAVGAIWILFSDWALSIFVKDSARINLYQTYKGWFFILATAAMLYHLVRWNNARLLRANRLLREQNERMLMVNAAVDAADASVVITDLDGIIKYVNRGFEQMTGYAHAEALGLRPDDLVRSFKHPQEFHDQLWKTINAGRTWKGQLINRCKSGKLIEVDSTIAPIFGTEQRIIGFVGVNRDITHQRALEDQLRQAQKMEAIGQLAGGVAHDFNNLLQVILGNTELIMPDFPIHGDARIGLDQIVEAAERAARLVRQLLTFSRRSPMQPRLLDLSQVIGELSRMLRRVIGANIDLRIELGDQLGLIRADAGQIEQILMNLSVNARDAIGFTNGQIRIETSRADFNEEFCRTNPWARAGSFVRMTVADTGQGIPEPLIGRVFEPFFTTKEAGKGTGLGLATVYGIVRQHEALITISSAVGKGTEFHVYWPIVEGESLLGEPALETRQIPGRGECVLVVEDNELVRDLTLRILSDSGYDVLTATDGVDAMEVVGRVDARIDLAFVDIVMPRMGGREFCIKLKEIRPELPVILCSGFTPEEERETPPLDERPLVLQKPFRPQELLSAVARELKHDHISREHFAD